MLRHLLALPGDSEVITQPERLRYYGACDEEIVSTRRTERVAVLP
jgi:hypothetical protein